MGLCAREHEGAASDELAVATSYGRVGYSDTLLAIAAEDAEDESPWWSVHFANALVAGAFTVDVADSSMLPRDLIDT